MLLDVLAHAPLQDIKPASTDYSWALRRENATCSSDGRGVQPPGTGLCACLTGWSSSETLDAGATGGAMLGRRMLSRRS